MLAKEKNGEVTPRRATGLTLQGMTGHSSAQWDEFIFLKQNPNQQEWAKVMEKKGGHWENINYNTSLCQKKAWVELSIQASINYQSSLENNKVVCYLSLNLLI